MRGKLIDGALVYAPRDIVYNNIKYIPATDEILELDGWKEIVNTPMPEDAPELYRYVPYWEDGNVITKVWALVEYTDLEKIEYYKEKLTETDKYFIQNADGGSTEEEYAAMKAQRQEWRDKINELEGEDE